jgi:hypothetical protein
VAVSGEQIAVLDAAARRGRKPWYVDAAVRLVRDKPLGAVGAAIVLLLLLVAVFAGQVSTENRPTTSAPTTSAAMSTAGSSTARGCR